jgi:hypothetical protein
VDPGRVDLVIEDCLRRMVEALGLDRSTLFQRSGEDPVVTHPSSRQGELEPLRVVVRPRAAPKGSTKGGSSRSPQASSAGATSFTSADVRAFIKKRAKKKR